MDGVLFVAVVVLFLVTLNLRGRVQKLEQHKESSTSQLPQQPSSTTPAQPAQPWINPQKKSTEPNVIDDAIDWIKEDWLLKLGALLLLIAFGWFASYAFLHNWIGPMGRILLGVAAGVAFMGFGTWRIHKYIQQASVFLVLGSTVVLLTLFAAREIYDFFTPTTVLVAMFMAAAFVGFMSVRVKSRTVAMISLVLSAIAPLLTNAPSPDYVWLFSYLVVVVIGALWVVSVTGWREMTLAAVLLVAAYSVQHLIPSYPATLATAAAVDLLWFAYGFAVLFFVASLIGMLKGDKKTMGFDMVTAAANGVLLLWWVLGAAPEQWLSIILLGAMVVHAGAGYAVLKKTTQREPFYVYSGVAILLLGAATAIELEGSMLVIAYTIESVIIPVIVYLALRDTRIAQLFSVLLVGPMVLSAQSITSRAWNTGVFHEEFFVLLLLSLVLFAFGFYFWKHGSEQLRNLNIGTVILGSAYAYMLLWLSLHAALINDDTAVMISLVVYTLAGLATHFYGKMHQRKGFEYYGGAVLGCVVARLLLVDVWDMELTGRIITFFLIGTLLVSTAFIGRKKRNELARRNAPGHSS